MAKNSGLSFADKKTVVSKGMIREILETIFYCFAAILLGLVLVVAFGYKAKVFGPSMQPILHDSQTVLVDRFIYKMLSPSRGDIVCFYPKGNTNSHIYTKRVVGLPGETVQIKDGRVYIDGVRLIEDNDFDFIDDAGLAGEPFILESNEYFVLGDNRNSSEDSRNGNIGAVLKDTMVGKAWFGLSGSDGKFGFLK